MLAYWFQRITAREVAPVVPAPIIREENAYGAHSNLQHPQNERVVLIVDDRLNSNGARCAPPGTGSGEFRSSSTGIYNLK
jgi:hypothetical protein